MYSNLFDTVKTTEIDLINCEGLLYSSILSGLHPTFSLNQAIDSTALLNIIQKDKKFLYFIKERYIQVALFGKYTGEQDGITLFLKDKLYECTNENKASFKFSSLPFLYDDEYTEAQLLAIYNVMLKILDGEKKTFTSYMAKNIGIDTNKDDIFKLEAYLKTVQDISDAVNGHYILPTNENRNETLYEKVINDISILCNERKNSDLLLCLEEFKKILQKHQGISPQELNSRSNMYRLIDIMECPEKIKKELKSMVDLCYNEIVAASISDNEDDIMSNNDNYEYSQIYEKHSDNNIDRAEQKLSLLRNAKNNKQVVFSWDLLIQILDEAKPNKNDLDKWHYDMEEYCRQLGFNNVKLKRKKIFVGIVPFVITVLHNTALTALEKRYYGDSIIAPIMDRTATDIIKDVGIKVVGQILSLPTQIDLNQQIIKNQSKIDTVKTLISQVSLLKEDYNHKKRGI